MRCDRCGGSNIQISRTTEVKRKRGIATWVYWLFGFWVIDIFIWIFAFVPRLLVGIFRPRGYKTKTNTEAVCQSCGNVWKVK